MAPVRYRSNGHSETTDIIHGGELSAAAANAFAGQSQSPLAMIDDCLRGRWRIAIALGLVLGTIFAFAGYRLAPRKYKSTGTIHVVPSGTPILRETPETGMVPRYDGMVATQAIFVRSPRVVDQALQDDANLAALPLAKLPNARETILADLAAAPVRGAELISVSYESESAAEAQIVVNAILQSYEALYGKTGDANRANTMSKLRDEERTLRAERNLKQQQIEDFIEQHKIVATNIETMMQMKTMQLEQLKQDIQTRELELAALEKPADAPTNPNDTAGPTDAALESIDPGLAQLRQDKQMLELRLDQLRGRFVNSNHPSLLEAERALQLTNSAIEAREATARRKWMETGGLGLSPGLSIEQAKDDLQRRIDLRDHYETEIKTMTDAAVRLRQLEREEQEISERHAEVKERMRMLDIESAAVLGGSISISELGPRPQAPSVDRRKQFAGAGFIAGLGLSFGLFFLLGNIDRRTYSSTQFKRQFARYRCLGVLPDLGAGRLDPEMSETAVQCVHQIRNRIEALRDPVPSFMLVVTSPYQGDGKTSLSMALGWSYAAAGYRTLLIDCDLIGRSLTRQLGLSDRNGLREVLRDRRLDTQIAALPVPNLHALGVGLDDSIGPESIRRDDFGTLCNELRRQFDVIIADTGPFIGSVEVLPVVSAADSVVFSIRRGRSRGRLDDCLSDLELSQVPCLGVVLNCAVRSDCVRYVSKSVVSMRQLPPATTEASTEKAKNQSRSGENKLVQAMGRTNGQGSAVSAGSGRLSR